MVNLPAEGREADPPLLAISFGGLINSFDLQFAVYSPAHAEG